MTLSTLLDLTHFQLLLLWKNVLLNTLLISLLLYVHFPLLHSIAVIIEGPVTTIALPPVNIVQFSCTHTEGVLSQWDVDGISYSQMNWPWVDLLDTTLQL